MNPTPRPPYELDVSGVLTPTQFKDGTDLWLSTRSAGGTALTNCLLVPGGPTGPSGSSRLPAVYFPVMQIVELVSAVGVQSIRARFVVLRDANQQLRFTVALYAVGADGTVLSSYYLANRYWPKTTSPVPHANSGSRVSGLRLSRSVSKNVIPKALASYWVDNWTGSRYPTKPDLFTSAGQPMQGYNFSVSDFMDPLRGLNNFGNQLLAMNFCLHTFLNFNGTVDAPVASLGLLLQMTNTTEKDEAGTEDELYDVAHPSPPAP